MGFMGALFGGGAEGAGKGVKSALDGVSGLVSTIKGELPPEAAIKLKELDNAISLAQVEANKIEAQHPSLFVAGWRPAIGWICATGVFVQFIVYPMLLLYAAWFNYWLGTSIVVPNLMSAMLMELVLGMLGLGALRTIEKFRGVQGKH
jgi:hypothetical protein